MINKDKIINRCSIIAVLAIVVIALLSGGCGSSGSALPAPTTQTDENMSGRTIPYPEGIELGGAASYNHETDHRDSRYFAVGNDWYLQESTDTLTILSGFATYQQTTEFTCGPAAILMVLYHYDLTTTGELEIAAAVDTDDTVGTTPEAVRDYFTALGWQTDSHVSTQTRFEDPDEFSVFVREQLRAGQPILVDWTRWGGHWSVIIGLDTLGTEIAADDVIILADPYDTTDHSQDGYYVVGIEEFFYEWHEGICTGKAEPYQQPFVSAHP